MKRKTMTDYFKSQINMLAGYLRKFWGDEINEGETAVELAIRLLETARSRQKQLVPVCPKGHLLYDNGFCPRCENTFSIYKP